MTRPFEGFAAEVLESIPAADRKRPVAWKHMAAVCEAVLSIAAEKNAALEARIAELEGRPELRDAGPWKEGKAYRKGEIVSYQGSAWICRNDTTTRPAGSQMWRLLVKKGKDAAK